MVLITGGTGFLGSYIIRELVDKGYKVRAIKRVTGKLPFYIPAHVFAAVEWVEGDILDLYSIEKALEGVDAVVHAAAIVSFRKEDKEKIYKINVEGTANIVNLALEKNIRRFVHISSVSALGRLENAETVTEKKQWQESETNTNYAISKFKAEMEVWRAAAEGLGCVIINPSTVLGYGDWNTSSCALFKTAYKEFPYYTEGVHGFVYVEDVAKATVALLESDIINERFILNSENWSLRQLLTAMATAFGKKQPRINATPFLASIAWRAEKLKSFFTGAPTILSRETAKIAQTKTYFDNSKLLSTLPGFFFTPLQDAITLSCEKYIAAVQDQTAKHKD